MMVIMEMLVLLDTVYGYRDMRTRDAALDGRLPCDMHSVETDLVEFLEKPVLITHEFQKRGREHIAGGTHGAIYIQSSHLLASM